MWDRVSHEVAQLRQDLGSSLEPVAVTDWAHTVAVLLAVRRSLGPVSSQDPFAMVATTTAGVLQVDRQLDGGRWVLGPLRDALRLASGDLAAVPAEDRDHHIAALTTIAYKVTNLVRARSDEEVRPWLLVGATALGAAIHAPALRSSTAGALASWQEALVAVQAQPASIALRRGVTHGHLAILLASGRLIDSAVRAGALPESYAEPLLTDVRSLSQIYRDVLVGHVARQAVPVAAEQAAMIRLGRAVRDFAARESTSEAPGIRLAALLRTGLGQTPIAAPLTMTASSGIALRLHQRTVEYLTTPAMLKADPWNRGRTTTASAPGQGTAPPPRAVVQPSIDPGTVLGPEVIAGLCHARDVGRAAAVADPSDPPTILAGTDPASWPGLVEAGLQATADMVTSVVPMVHALVRQRYDYQEQISEAFTRLMDAARTFDPHKPGSASWSSFAWNTINYSLKTKFDQAGVRLHHAVQRPGQLSLHQFEAVDSPVLGAEDRGDMTLSDIKLAVRDLPVHVQEALNLSIAGHTTKAIAESLGISESTAARRLEEARDILRPQLLGARNEATTDDVVDPQWESVTTREPAADEPAPVLADSPRRDGPQHVR